MWFWQNLLDPKKQSMIFRLRHLFVYVARNISLMLGRHCISSSFSNHNARGKVYLSKGSESWLEVRTPNEKNWWKESRNHITFFTEGKAHREVSNHSVATSSSKKVFIYVFLGHFSIFEKNNTTLTFWRSHVVLTTRMKCSKCDRDWNSHEDQEFLVMTTWDLSEVSGKICWL